MSPALVAVLEHQAVVGRRRSRVFHLYSGALTASGRTPRAARPLCGARTRPLDALGRVAAAFDLGGRRFCVRCSVRLSAAARRAEQPPVNLDARAAFFAGATIEDLYTGLAVAATEADTYAVGLVANQLHGRVLSIARHRPDPATAGAAVVERFDLEVAILRRRDHLRAMARTPEERAAIAQHRADRAVDDARIAAGRREAAVRDRAIDRRNRGQYLTRRERELIT